MNDSATIQTRIVKSLYRKSGHPGSLKDRPVIVRGDNTFVWDTEGRRYLDMTAGGGRVLVGHGNPAVLDAIHRQSLCMLSHPTGSCGDVQARLMHRLLALAPAGFRQVCLTASDQGAARTAVRMARCWTGRSGVRTVSDRLPTVDELAGNCAAVIFAPIRYQLDMARWPRRAVEELAARCRAAGALLIWDERCCGCGRTGRFLALERYAVRPDILLLGGPLGGGLPLGAVLVHRRWTDVSVEPELDPVSPVAAAAALAVLDYLHDHDLARQAGRNGAFFRRALAHSLPAHRIRIHGAGLMLGLTLTLRVGPILSRLVRLGVLASAAGGGSLALLPPLTISPSQIEAITGAVRSALASADTPDRPGA